MRVNFILPTPTTEPIGGYKVQYQYADRLGSLGHRATILHSWTLSPTLPRGGLARFVAKVGSLRIRRTALAPWHEFGPGTRIRLFPSPHMTVGIPRADVTILTAWQTAAYLPSSQRWGQLVHVVYDYEHWRTASPFTREQMAEALRRPGVTRFAASNAVCAMLGEAQSDCAEILNPGIDLTMFQQVRDIDGRGPTVSFPLRSGLSKGVGILLTALETLRERLPDLRVMCFGAGSEGVPAWIESYGLVSRRELVEIYNRSSVFVLPSLYEGWGLPALEAMACGAAVVSTRNGGVEDFCTDGVNGRLVTPGNALELAGAIEGLFADPADRLRIAERGVQMSQKFGLAAATDHFVEAIERLVS